MVEGLLEHDLGATLLGEAEDAGGDGRESDGVDLEGLLGHLERVPDGVAELLLASARLPAVPDGTDGVDHEATGKTSGFGPGGFASEHFAMLSNPGIAFVLDAEASLANDGSSNSTSVGQVAVGSVDDGLAVLGRKVTFANLESASIGGRETLEQLRGSLGGVEGAR